MATPPLAVIDLLQLAGIEPFPLSLFSDANRSTPDIALDGALWPGAAYAYALQLQPGMEYRFATSGAEDGFAERAMLVEQATGDVVWANAIAAEGFGYDAAAAAGLAARPVEAEAAGTHLLYVWDTPAPSGVEPMPRAFHLEAHADAIEPPPPPPPPPPPVVTDNEIYRFFDPVLGIERLTANAAMRDQLLVERPDLRYDGVAFVADDAPRDGWVPVHEVLDYGTGQRYYTPHGHEIEGLLAAHPQAANQGVAFWVPAEAGAHTAPVYRMTNLDSGNWFVTSNLNERLYLLLQGNWADQGAAFNAWVPPPPEPSPAVDTGAGVSVSAALVGVAEDAPPLIG